MSVPRFSIVIPIRRRLHFVHNTLPAVYSFAERKDHEVILAVDEVSIEHEYRRRTHDYSEDGRITGRKSDARAKARVHSWLDRHKPRLTSHGTQVIYSTDNPNAWTGGLRASHAGNIGVAAASEPWIVLFDEDLLLTKNWDRALWDRMAVRDPMKTEVMPYSCKSRTMDPPIELKDVTYEWVEEQRKIARNEYQFPRPDECPNNQFTRLNYSDFEDYARRISQPGEWEEPCGERARGHTCCWLMHKNLFWQAGGWLMEDDHAYSYDMHFDDRLRSLGVTKVITKDCFALQTKSYCEYDQPQDPSWAELPPSDPITGLEVC